MIGYFVGMGFIVLWSHQASICDVLVSFLSSHSYVKLLSSDSYIYIFSHKSHLVNNLSFFR